MKYHYIKAITEIWNFSCFKTFQFSSVRLIQSAVRSQLAAAHPIGYFPEHWKQIHREKFCSQIIHRRKIVQPNNYIYKKYGENTPIILDLLSARITERILLSYQLKHGGNTPTILNFTFTRNKERILLSYSLIHGENTPTASRNTEGILLSYPLTHRENTLTIPINIRREYSYHTLPNFYKRHGENTPTITIE